MGDWNLFFATTAGSAATLVGLLFVATQLHIDVFTDPASRWSALAQGTLTILAVTFASSLFFLIPGVGLQVRGEVVVLVVLFGIWRSARIWWPVVKLGETGRGHRIAQSFWLLVLPIVGYLYLLTSAVGLWSGDASALYNVGGGFLMLFAISLRNAWRLAVQSAPEKR